MAEPATDQKPLECVLTQHEPARGLQVLLTLARLPFAVRNAAYPRFVSADASGGGGGELPQLTHGGALAAGERAFALVAQAAPPGAPLHAPAGAAPAARAAALAALVRGPLADAAAWARLHSLQHARAAARACAQPLALFVPRERARLEARRLAARGVADEAWCRARADEAYRALAQALEEGAAYAGAPGAPGAPGAGFPGGAFFFGREPCWLDAAVFAHLDAVRQTRAGGWAREAAPALVHFHARVRRAFFDDEDGSVAAPFAVARRGRALEGAAPSVFAQLERLVDQQPFEPAGAPAGAPAAPPAPDYAFRFGEAPDAAVEAALRQLRAAPAAEGSWAEALASAGVALVGAGAAAAVYALSLPPEELARFISL